MKEWLRFAVAFWHTFRGDGSDPFGSPTKHWPWEDGTNSLAMAKRRMRAAFEFMSKLGAQFWCFHDRDIAPEGATLAESNANLDEVVALAAELQAQTGIRPLWGTAQLFKHPRYRHGAATSPVASVYAYAAAQVKKAMEVTHRLGGENYVFWGGREGYSSLVNTDMGLELDHLARFLAMAADWREKLGFKGTLLMEPKPQEPTKHQYDWDAATTLGFLVRYNLTRLDAATGTLQPFKLNLECNHATLAGHSCEHELETARIAGVLGGVDANTGDAQTGWDTDEFLTDPAAATRVMLAIVRNGGLAPGGINFDAKLRRESTDVEDLFIAHIAGMDALARGLRSAAAIIEAGDLDKLVRGRYASWKEGIGARIEKGEVGFEELEAAVMADGGKEPELDMSTTAAPTANGLKLLDVRGREFCQNDTTPPIKASTMDELHRLQKKKSNPTTPRGSTGGDQNGEKFQQQLESISASLASHVREHGPKIVTSKCKPASQGHRAVAPSQPCVSDSSLKLTHVLYNLSPAELYEQAIKYEKGSFITSSGALATLSGAKTGRSPKDKASGSPNIEMDAETFLVNRERAVDYLNSLDKVFVNDQFLNWDTEHRLKVRIVSARAYHALFMHNMCIRPTAEELESFGKPDFTIYNAGQFPCNRFTHYMTSSTSIDLNLQRKEMVILGTQYAGEMKKGLFSVMHYLMPKRGVLSLHSGCNMGKAGDVALFFGLSGMGKTTLSTDENRDLIGDDEHCWTDNGVSNIEGGCYAKCIGLSAENEKEIFNAIKFGTVLENVVFDEHTREVDYDDKSVTENTRASYPIEFIPNARIPCVGPHPKNVILLACDAFGVLPPVSRLSLPQTMYHFISGYTALVAGTEDGVKEPRATFSACFGAAFIIATPIFGLQVPHAVNDVPSEILMPQNMWEDKAAYEATLVKLARLFQDNFKKFAEYDGNGSDGKLAADILAAGPHL
ncbi:unnamed protein product [Closterium sp. Naga37s-1]|nr:unnamed protein product [Closterium sp. Naga37s-1]